ncbi:cytochrome c-type biogenesis protein CcmH [Vibrio tapetis]|uniref:Cytochrome c-type biogenesis protein n=1 Tax=Vibrio tapetis subsp. tapetis TaxID=1671868 RepID=A0A2N8Z8V3_9VIBR|nr:cytochrome c-type biogenesis protein CcmH [Vibrio tapetis]SON48320.1 Heme lyase (NrfEFG) for insertion of heme into c552, subunit NrfF [Vibrio tapetis subsp. tapetis]
MKISRFHPLILALFLSVFSVQLSAEVALFSKAESEKISKVELFEFESPEQQKRAIALAKELRCPQCQNQNLVESNSPIAQDLRLKVYQKVKQGETNEAIKAGMVKQFGEFVLYRPEIGTSTFMLWLLPLLAVAVFIYYVLSSVRTKKV